MEQKTGLEAPSSSRSSSSDWIALTGATRETISLARISGGWVRGMARLLRGQSGRVVATPGFETRSGGDITATSIASIDVTRIATIMSFRLNITISIPGHRPLNHYNHSGEKEWVKANVPVEVRSGAKNPMSARGYRAS